MIDLCLGRVDVLGLLLVLLEYSRAETDRLSAKIVNRKYHPVSEAVIHSGAISFLLQDKTCFQQYIFLKACRFGFFVQMVPTIPRIAQLKLFDYLGAQASFLNIYFAY